MNLRPTAASATLAGLVCLAGCAGVPDAATEWKQETTPVLLRPEARQVFRPGAVEVYDVQWGGFLPVATIRHEITLAEEEGGRLLLLDAVTEPRLFIAAFMRIGGRARAWLDPVTLLPRASLWVNADAEDPLTRTAWFEPDGGVHTAKFAKSVHATRKVEGALAVDPLTVFFLGRCLDYDALGVEARLLVAEGGDLHLMILRQVSWNAATPERPEWRGLTIESHRLDPAGNPLDEEPLTLLSVEVEERFGLPAVRMSGRLPEGRVSLSLREGEESQASTGDAPLERTEDGT